MSIDTLPRTDMHETEAIKPFNSFSGAIAWIENAAQKLGASTVSIKGAKTLVAEVKDKITAPDNVEVAKLFSEADADILFQRNKHITLPDFPSLEYPPVEGWPLNDTGSNVLMRVVDAAGGEYNLSLDKTVGKYGFETSISSSISYTTQRGTELEHTTSLEVGINRLDGPNTDDPKTVAEYLTMAAGLRNAIIWKVESLAPEMQDDLKVDDKRSGFMKRTIGRIAGGSSVKQLYK